MIGFFPDPYPDELFYSACARYGRRLDYPNKQSVITELFGRRGLSAIVDFPTRLGYFLSVIQTNKYSAEGIINNNTLFPFYEPFIMIERAKFIRKEMKTLTDNHIGARLAININQINLPNFLRFCPLCVKIDRAKFGETFWHRLHQLAGVFVCPEHLCFLENSQVKWERESSGFFHAAEDFITPVKARFLDKRKTFHKTLLKISENARWLLNQKKLSLKSGVLRERYYNILLQKGYAWYNGRIKSKKLIKDFLAYFPPDVLKMIGCEMEIEKTTWLERMVKKNLADVLNHPIRHLLLLDFLNIDLNDFFPRFKEFKPFGDPPYPCLNIAAGHYKQLIINHCRINDNLTKNNKLRLPVAVFSCECGFIYRRLGPDKSSKDKFKFNSVAEYGKVWEEKLTDDWNNLELSASEIGRRFGTTIHLVTRHAIRLNLPMNTENTRKVEGYNRHRNPQRYFSENLNRYRTEWLEIIKKEKKLNRKALSEKYNFIYLWLKRNDTEWFESHLPPPFIPNRKKEFFDWNKIDREISKKVKETCSEILNEENPVRVSITEIIKRIGYKKWLDKRDKKLPLTCKVLNKLLESLEDFMLRKLKITEEKFIRERKVPSFNQLITRAVIRNTTTNNSPKIQKEIIETIERIKKQLLFSK